MMKPYPIITQHANARHPIFFKHINCVPSEPPSQINKTANPLCISVNYARIHTRKKHKNVVTVDITEGTA
jgi:hypothetical protein